MCGGKRGRKRGGSRLREPAGAAPIAAGDDALFDFRLFSPNRIYKDTA
jgi:hypothetical protein